MNDLQQAFTQLSENELLKLAQSYCATKVSSVIVNKKSLKSKTKDLEDLKKLDLVQALPEDFKNKMFEMFDTAKLACAEMSKIKNRF